MATFRVLVGRNRTRLITLAILVLLFVFALQGMETEDWVITMLRGLSVGAIVFLVAAGLSLIFGLMDVLNLAHGEIYMLGAYIGWTVYVRPDTFVDVLPPALLVAAGFVLTPLWRMVVGRLSVPRLVAQIWPWVAIVGGIALMLVAARRYPIAIWDDEVYTESPITYALAMDQGNLILPAGPQNILSAQGLILAALFLSGAALAIGIVGLSFRAPAASRPGRINGYSLAGAAILVVAALATFLGNSALTEALLTMSTTWRFMASVLVAALSGVILGALIETTMIRPLYERPIYQIMLTLGLGFIVIEFVRTIWGRPEFTMPKPALFAGSGEGCPAENIGGWLANQCSTILLFDSRVRTYNEIFIILVGILVLVGIWLLLQRTRLGMIIRAGVQDREMVEALGINVRRVFTLVFALGVGLAAMGGVLAAPSLGLANSMGTRLLLLALIALAIGGLTSFPGAAAGAVLVGLLQQFIVKYGQIGISLPFLAEPFKPSPPLVPASVVLLMVIILLVLPQGLFGRSE
jgi:branched-chain amino acid transport system permease protein